MIARTDDAHDLSLPARATAASAGLDLHANVPEDVTLAPGQRVLIPTGVRIALPPGYEVQLRPRSGLALKHGVSMVNAPGTIDADYRGQLQVLLINWGEAAFTVRRGDRIAQMVVCPVVMVDFAETDCLPDSVRGEGGFGHTGL